MDDALHNLDILEATFTTITSERFIISERLCLQNFKGQRVNDCKKRLRLDANF